MLKVFFNKCAQTGAPANPRQLKFNQLCGPLIFPLHPVFVILSCILSLGTPLNTTLFLSLLFGEHFAILALATVGAIMFHKTHGLTVALFALIIDAILLGAAVTIGLVYGFATWVC